ncbi:MAG: proline dehydrogenase family protein [Bacteroidota bacterium]
MQSETIQFDDTETAFAYRTKEQLKKSHFVFSTMNYPWMVRLGVWVTNRALRIKLPVRKIIKNTLFNQFCGGESIEDCRQTIQLLGEHNVQTILDYSVEGVKSEDGYDDAKKEALRVVEFASRSNHIPFIVLKLSALGSTELMTKAQNKDRLTEMEKTKLYYCEQRVIEIVHKVYEKGLMVMLDAEESWFQNFTDGVAQRLMEKFNRERPVVFNTYQLYRQDVLNRLKFSLAKATNGGYYLGAKLVRGAYMEKERERAERMGYTSPIHETKEAVDEDYDAALKLCVEHIDRMGLCGGTHNETSARYLVALMNESGLSPSDPRIYFAQLLGMSDNISFVLSNKGYNVAKYVPYGPVEDVLPYLFRRAEENTSIAGQSSREYTLIKKELKRRNTVPKVQTI